MSEPNAPENPLANLSREEMMSALFANLIMQQTNMALIFLGKAPHPESGETIRDLEMAQVYITMLEMLEARTKGNLDAREQGLLKQSLMTVRMAFVEVAEAPASPSPAPEAKPPPAKAEPAKPAEAPPSPGQPATEHGAAAEAESRKKFSKKY